MLLKQHSVQENNILLFHNNNIICSISHSMLPLMISFPNLKHNSPPKQMFVYQGKKGFVSHGTYGGFQVCVSLQNYVKTQEFLKKIQNFLIFLIAKNGFKM